jgi:hypothetical protein
MNNANELAFPLVVTNLNGDSQVSAGLNKRELISAMAMQGYLSMYAGPDIAAPVPIHAAQACVEYADALLAELAK